jgi:type VII secretion integral membrane protein EccD
VPTGLARITVSAPGRRLDVALPDGTPVAELLPELLRHADAVESGPDPAPAGWVLRRADGAALAPGRGLAAQGIVDGEILHLAPVALHWPPPAYDDPAEAVVAGMRSRGAQWSVTTTRVATRVVAALLLAGGLVAALARPGAVPPVVPTAVAVAALVAGVLAVRRGQPATAALTGAAALAYAFLAGTVAAGGVAAGGVAVLVTSLVAVIVAAAPASVRDSGRVGALSGRYVFVAGITIGLLGTPAALAGDVWGASAAAAVLACVLVCGLGALPSVAVRLGGLPVAPAGPDGTSAEVLGREVAHAAVARADELLIGLLGGWSVLAVAAVGLLLVDAGPAGAVLAAVTATALALRARLFVAVRHRLPLLGGAVAGYALVAVPLAASAPPEVLAAAVAAVAVAALLAGVGAGSLPAPVRLGPARLAQAADTLAVVAVVPLAAAVLDLYAATHTLLT